MKSCKILFLLSFISTLSLAQNINYESLDISFYRYPLKPLSKELKTYSSSIQELNANLTDQQKKDLLDKGLVIPGFKHVQENGDVQPELVISPLTVTNKELKDSPFTTEKNGVKTVYHKYYYKVTFNFPSKLRVTSKGQVITEQDLPGYFTKDYPQIAETESALQQKYDDDRYFLESVRSEKIEERIKEIHDQLFSHYGYGMYGQMLSIGYVKDKKGEYQDLSKALSLMNSAFTYANNKENYLDEMFKGKINEAITLYEGALKESSEDKKARIDQKVAAMINYNLALAYYGLNDVTKAEAYLLKIQKAGNETETWATQLKDLVKDKRARLVPNGLLIGTPATAGDAPKPIQQVTSQVKSSTRDYIVAKPGDTLDVKFIIPSSETMRYGDSLWLQDQIIVMKNNKRVEFYPGEIHGYNYKGVYRESLTWTKDMNTRPWTFEKKFCKRILDGTIPVFKKYELTPHMTDASDIQVTTRTYYKQNENIWEFMFLNFNKGVSKVVKDYPELSERVKNGAYTREQFLDIIKEYNEWVKNKAKI